MRIIEIYNRSSDASNIGSIRLDAAGMGYVDKVKSLGLVIIPSNLSGMLSCRLLVDLPMELFVAYGSLRTSILRVRW